MAVTSSFVCFFLLSTFGLTTASTTATTPLPTTTEATTTTTTTLAATTRIAATTAAANQTTTKTSPPTTSTSTTSSPPPPPPPRTTTTTTSSPSRTKTPTSTTTTTKTTTTTSTAKPLACRGTQEVTTSEPGWITSPGFDGKSDYESDLVCLWRFKAPVGMVYEFSFTALEIEQSTPCQWDYLKVTEHYTKGGVQMQEELAKLCGKKGLPDEIMAKRPIVELLFISDSDVTALGFNVSYKLVPAPYLCDDSLWKCKNADLCINRSKVCDRNNDCTDGSDELLCPYIPGCGESAIPQKLISSRIVGGNLAVRGSWPWTVALLRRDGAMQCGATLIHPQWAITASHCFLDTDGLDGHSIIAGRYVRNQTDRNEQRRDVSKLFQYKRFYAKTSINDIILVRLKQPFRLTDYVRTICMPAFIIQNGEYGWAMGWGYTRYAPFSPICCESRQKQVTLPVINTQLCNSTDYYDNKIFPHMLCAGYTQGGKDTCQGDSGGPFVRRRADDNRWEIQGVVSWGKVCGAPKNPGVYTVVKDYADWIRKTVIDNTEHI